MSLIPTRSKDGKRRVTMQVSHRVDLDLIVDVVCYERSYGEVETDLDLTKRDVERFVRAWLYSSGAQSPEWEGWDDETTAQRREWARQQVLRHWPEFTLDDTRRSV